jgi:magnesium transporter
MLKLLRRASKKAGLAPGTLVHTGERKAEKTRITIIDYDRDNLRETEAETVEACAPYRDTPTVTWINVSGLHDVSLVEKLGECFRIHPLVLEDILNTYQRPKIEEYDDQVFIVLKMLYRDSESGEITAEQLSMVVGENYVISFQERPQDVFDGVRERLRSSRRRIRERGADYLAYALLDAVVDSYFLVLEALGEQIEALEEDLLQEPTAETLHAVHDLKRELIFLRRSVWPLREVISLLARGDRPLFSDETILYLRDVYDHTIQVVDTIESYRDLVAGMHDTYLSSVSNRMNEVMKVLTIFASIFIPLTFLVGVYGMNFQYMPELGWRWGYPGVWAAMLILGAGMLLYFRRKKWL